MRVLEPAVERFGQFLGLLLLSIAVMEAPAAAADPNAPAETTGAFHAAAFSPLPDSPRVEVRLVDDSPENLELGWQLQQELQRRGLAAGNGDSLVLTVETDVAITPDPDAPAPEAGQSGGLEVIGFLRATLDHSRTEERFWEAEAAYRRSDGDLPAGARSLVPLLVEQIGHSVELDSVRIR